VASLLSELLHDTSRRGDEIAAELTRLRSNLPSDVEAYRGRMQQMVEQARQIVSSMLADPDLEDPLYATSYFRDYKYVARLMQELENLPVLVLRRFSEQDRIATALMAAICREVRFPYPAPICSSISSQYYWTVAGMDVVFVPCLEPDHLLGIPDGYHELGHILLFRAERRLVHPGLTLVDRWYDKTIAEGRKLNWPQPSLDQVDQFRHRWRQSWLLEFGSDLIATYLVGPAFGWCNIRTSTNLGGELFSGNESHPADDARALAIGLMLERIGCSDSATAIRQRWSELVKLSNESRPHRYDLAYPEQLLRELTEFVHRECVGLGLQQFQPDANESTPVTSAVNDAWRECRANPAKFGNYEQTTLADLLHQIGC
jgi:hypothetical protein